MKGLPLTDVDPMISSVGVTCICLSAAMSNGLLVGNGQKGIGMI